MSPQDDSTDLDRQRVVLVTGPSGAGRTTAIRALEDLGWEVIDNLPLSLLPRLIDGPPHPRPLALGVDVRNRDFGADSLIETADALAARPDIDDQIVFLDASEDILVRRFAETRRRHPLAPSDSPLTGLRAERDLLGPIRARAHVLIDTGEMTPHELRAEIDRYFAGPDGRRLSIEVASFSYKRGLPRGVDFVFDCRFLANPHWEPALRDFDGRDAEVDAYVTADPLFQPFYDTVAKLLDLVLPASRAEGKSHLSVAFGCTGGQHRSVAIAERMATSLAAAGWTVAKRHRELERRDRPVSALAGTRDRVRGTVG